MGGERERISGDYLVVGVGGGGNRERLGLKKRDVKVRDGGLIEIGDKMERRVGDIYGIGDVSGGGEVGDKGRLEGKIGGGGIGGDGEGEEVDYGLGGVGYREVEMGNVGERVERGEGKEVEVKVWKLGFGGNGGGI